MYGYYRGINKIMEYMGGYDTELRFKYIIAFDIQIQCNSSKEKVYYLDFGGNSSAFVFRIAPSTHLFVAPF